MSLRQTPVFSSFIPVFAGAGRVRECKGEKAGGDKGVSVVLRVLRVEWVTGLGRAGPFGACSKAHGDARQHLQRHFRLEIRRMLLAFRHL